MRGYVVECNKCKGEQIIYIPKPWPKGFAAICDNKKTLGPFDCEGDELRGEKCGGRLLFIRYEQK